MLTSTGIHGEVRTPAGFKEAYDAFVEGGWASLACDPLFGGQGASTHAEIVNLPVVVKILGYVESETMRVVGQGVVGVGPPHDVLGLVGQHLLRHRQIVRSFVFSLEQLAV